MATGLAQENQSDLTEGSCAPPSAASSATLVDDVPPRAILECHICMDAPTDPVATSCGHVFCWPCLGQWLQKLVKPCPIRRKLVSAEFNILPLHPGSGDVAGRPRASHGNDDSAGTREAAGAAGNVALIPPRPPNPLLFFPWEPSSSPESEVSESMAIVRAIREFVRERARGRSLAIERARQGPRLKQRKNEILRRISALRQETRRMGLHIGELERRLALATEPLHSCPPGGVHDGV